MTIGASARLVDELRSSRTLIDRATTTACRSIIARHDGEWSRWEIEQALRELDRLGRSADCTYDRPSIGVSYALWYQGKRTHDALRTLAPQIERLDGPLRIVDLGCGTGATACAVALVAAALERYGSPNIPEIVVDGIDSSPFMVEAAQEIFAALTREIDGSRVRATFRSMPWERVATTGDPTTTAIVGGYLLDHSDGAHADEIARRLMALADKLSASSVLLSTAASKRSHLMQVRTALQGEEWEPAADDFDRAPSIGRGALGSCHALRSTWYRSAGLTVRRLWSRRPAWSGDAPASLAMHRERGPISATLIPDERNARLVDAAQEKAATPERRLTVIIGAAGSGKTIVLSERIARTITDVPVTGPAPLMLVTAFNKAVVDLIVDKAMDSLEAAPGVTQVHRKRGEGDHVLEVFVSERTARVEFMNRDKLPHRVFGVPLFRQGLNLHDEWRREIERRRNQLDAVDRALVARLGHDFLADEFERVIFGLECFRLAAYQDVERKGRVTPLARGRTREAVWRLLMEPSPITSYVDQRMLAYRKHEAAVTQAQPAKLAKRWTHVFVDECQDFTALDIQLLARAPQDPRNLCMAGDASQSVHLGRSYHRPRIAGVQPNIHRLAGSYRLPLRVCEALQPLARDIHSSHLASRLGDELDTVLLSSRKAAVAGFRPIVLTGEQVARQLSDVLRAYVPAEPDQRLLAANCGRRTRETIARCQRGTHWQLENGLMEKYKGLEWPCVVVTNEPVGQSDTSEAASERLFTAMTRTTKLLVIVLWADGDADTTALLGRLDGDRLLFWDESASTAFDRARLAAPATS